MVCGKRVERLVRVRIPVKRPPVGLLVSYRCAPLRVEIEEYVATVAPQDEQPGIN